jgi:hypothetical protein
MGGNPTAISSALTPVAQFQTYTVSDVAAVYPTLSFRRANAADDLTQVVEFSSNLTTWPTTGVQVAAIDDGDGTRTEIWRASTPVTGAQRLYGRVRFVTP